MYDQILFPTDGSEPAESVLEYALQIASEHEAIIHVLNVVDPSHDSLSGMQDDVDDALEQDGTEIVNEAAQRATERGITVVSGYSTVTPTRRLSSIVRSQASS